MAESKWGLLAEQGFPVEDVKLRAPPIQERVGIAELNGRPRGFPAAVTTGWTWWSAGSLSIATS